MMDGNCLFCDDRLIPISLSTGDESSKPPNFVDLCELLNIQIPVNFLRQFQSLPQLLSSEVGSDSVENTCDKFLCFGCFERTDNLLKLYDQLSKVQSEIDLVIKQVKSVITDTVRNPKGFEETSETIHSFPLQFQRLVRDSQRQDENKTKSRSRHGTRTWRQRITPDEIEIAESSTFDEIKTEVDLNDVKEEKDDDTEEFPTTDDNFQDLARSKNDIPDVVTIMDTVSVQRLPLASSSSSIKTRLRRLRHKSSSDDPPKKRKKKKLVSKPSRVFSCLHCPATFTIAHRFYAHRKSHNILTSKSLSIKTIHGHDPDSGRKRVIARICSLCGFRVNGHQLAIFMEHSLSHEDSSTPLHSCDQCPSKFSLPLNLDLHRICCHQYSHVILKCEVCSDFSSKTQSQFISHLASHFPTSRIFPCKSCPMAAPTLDKLLNHMTKHSKSKRLFCPECPSSMFPSLKELYQHCHQVHPSLKELFQCAHCPKSFLMPITYRQHLKLSHGIGEDSPETGEFFCSQCNTGKVYKTRRSLDRHQKFYHGPDSLRPHKCPQCGRGFIYNSLLQKHIQEKHEKIRYPCPHCEKSYSEQVQLGHHMKIHTGEGLHTCPLCGKQFPRLQQLKVHSVVHLEKNGETKCVCEVCGKEFGNELHLRKHKGSHKEKSLECEFCQLKFRRPDHLRSHLRTHTGERPFQCPVETCGKGFNRRDILIVHMKVHGMSQEEAAKVYKQHLEARQKVCGTL